MYWYDLPSLISAMCFPLLLLIKSVYKAPSIIVGRKEMYSSQSYLFSLSSKVKDFIFLLIKMSPSQTSFLQGTRRKACTNLILITKHQFISFLTLLSHLCNKFSMVGLVQYQEAAIRLIIFLHIFLWAF